MIFFYLYLKRANINNCFFIYPYGMLDITNNSKNHTNRLPLTIPDELKGSINCFFGLRDVFPAHIKRGKAIIWDAVLKSKYSFLKPVF